MGKKKTAFAFLRGLQSVHRQLAVPCRAYGGQRHTQRFQRLRQLFETRFSRGAQSRRQDTALRNFPHTFSQRFYEKARRQGQIYAYDQIVERTARLRHQGYRSFAFEALYRSVYKTQSVAPRRVLLSRRHESFSRYACQMRKMEVGTQFFRRAQKSFYGQPRSYRKQRR